MTCIGTLTDNAKDTIKRQLPLHYSLLFEIEDPSIHVHRNISNLRTYMEQEILTTDAMKTFL